MATLLADRTARARVTEALRAGEPVTHCESPCELLDELSKGAELVVLGARDRSGVATSEVVRAVRVRFPLVALVGYADPAEGSVSHDAMVLVRAGVHELVLRGFDDCGVAMRKALARARDCSTSEHVVATIAPILRQAALPLIRCCCENATQNFTVAHLARAMGVDRKTIAVRLRRWSLPPPRVIIAWTRLLMAARALEAPGRSVEQVALTFDFASGGALRNLLKRHTGKRPRDVRGEGAFARLLQEFLDTLLCVWRGNDQRDDSLPRLSGRRTPVSRPAALPKVQV